MKSLLFIFLILAFSLTTRAQISETKKIVPTQSEKDSHERISKPGMYVGYSKPIYSEKYNVTSQYITMRDGVKLAIDICRPIDSITGKVVEKPLPVVWMHTPLTENGVDVLLKRYWFTMHQIMEIVELLEENGLKCEEWR